MISDQQQVETILQEIIDGVIRLPTAAERLQISYQELLQLLHDRNIDPPYSLEDLEHDIGVAARYRSSQQPLGRLRARLSLRGASTDYRPMVRQALRPFGDRTHLGPDDTTLCLFDDDAGCYLVADLVWQDGERALQPLVLVRVRQGKVVVEVNTTDADLDRLLLAAGIPYTDLVFDEQAPPFSPG